MQADQAGMYAPISMCMYINVRTFIYDLTVADLYIFVPIWAQGLVDPFFVGRYAQVQTNCYPCYTVSSLVSELVSSLVRWFVSFRSFVR